MRTPGPRGEQSRELGIGQAGLDGEAGGDGREKGTEDALVAAVEQLQAVNAHVGGVGRSGLDHAAHAFQRVQ